MAMDFWQLLAQFRDETGASEAWVLRKAAMNHGTFSAWRKRGIPMLPEPEDLDRLADTLKVDFDVLVDSMLEAEAMTTETRRNKARPRRGTKPQAPD